MTPAELLTEAFGGSARAGGRRRQAPDAELRQRPVPDANPIGWLVWHLTRVQDDHVAGVVGPTRSGTSSPAFDLPYDHVDHGYGHTSDPVAAVTDSPRCSRITHRRPRPHRRYLRTLGADDLDRVVDASWDPPVTLGVRLVSVVNDDTAHVGQAEYVRGLLPR